MTTAFIAAGSNLGNRESYLGAAKNILTRIPKVRFLRASKIYETEPAGGPPQGLYLNAVWEIQTERSARELLEQLLEIERALGRIRSGPNAPRTIDLDLLFYGQEMINEPGLYVPHPRLHERAFVLKPFTDLAPDWIHPEFQKTVRDLLEEILAKN